MAGGSPDPQGNNYAHNDTAFGQYNARLQSNDLPTFASTASKFAEWLGSDKAYYPNVRIAVWLPSRPPQRTPLIADLHSDCLLDDKLNNSICAELAPEGYAEPTSIPEVVTSLNIPSTLVVPPLNYGDLADLGFSQWGLPNSP